MPSANWGLHFGNLIYTRVCPLEFCHLYYDSGPQRLFMTAVFFFSFCTLHIQYVRKFSGLFSPSVPKRLGRPYRDGTESISICGTHDKRPANSRLVRCPLCLVGHLMPRFDQHPIFQAIVLLCPVFTVRQSLQRPLLTQKDVSCVKKSVYTWLEHSVSSARGQSQASASATSLLSFRCPGPLVGKPHLSLLASRLPSAWLVYKPQHAHLSLELEIDRTVTPSNLSRNVRMLSYHTRYCTALYAKPIKPGSLFSCFCLVGRLSHSACDPRVITAMNYRYRPQLLLWACHAAVRYLVGRIQCSGHSIFRGTG